MPCAMAIMFSVSAKNNLSDASPHHAIPLSQKHQAAALRSSFSAARSFYSFSASISPVYSKRPYFLFPGSQACPFRSYISSCGWAHAMLRIQEDSQLAGSWFRAPVTPQLPHTPAELLLPARTSFLLPYCRSSRYLVAPCLPTITILAEHPRHPLKPPLKSSCFTLQRINKEICLLSCRRIPEPCFSAAAYCLAFSGKLKAAVIAQFLLFILLVALETAQRTLKAASGAQPAPRIPARGPFHRPFSGHILSMSALSCPRGALLC